MNEWDEIKAILKEVGENQKRNEETINKLLKDQVKTDEQIKKTEETIDKLAKKTDEQIKKTEETIDKLAKKTDEQIKKTEETIDKLAKKTDEQIKKTEETIDKLAKKTDRTDEQIKRTSEEMERIFRKMDREFEKTREVVEKVTGGWGRFVEGIMSPSAVKTFRKMKYKIREVFHREQIFDSKGRVVTEIDTLIDAEKNGKKVLLVGEAKTTMTPVLFWRFINKKLTQIKKYLSKYKDYDIIGFVCSVNYEEEIDTTAIKEGIYLFRVTEEVAKLSVPKDFNPKVW